MIKLIINADDFGYSRVFNEKILEFLEKGFINSTTVMVNRIDETQNSQLERLIKLSKSEKISVGLHVEFDTKKFTKPQIIEQIEEQYQKFKSIFDFKPSHLDIHKLVASKELIFEINRFAESNSLAVRNHGLKTSAKHTTYPVFHCTGWVLKLDEIMEFLRTVTDGSSCELICHPGKYDPESKSSLNKEREEDCEIITKLHAVLKNQNSIQNVSYLDL